MCMRWRDVGSMMLNCAVSARHRKQECLADAQVTNRGPWLAFRGGRLLAVC